MEQIHIPYMTKKLLPDLGPSCPSDLSPATQMCQAYSLLRQLHFLFLCLECSTSKFSRTASLPFRSQCKCCLLSRAFLESFLLKPKWPSQTCHLTLFFIALIRYSELSSLCVCLLCVPPPRPGTSSISFTAVSSAPSKWCIPNKYGNELLLVLI